MTRDEVLEEFRSDACENECDATDCIVERAMADEIVRLREEKDAVFDNLFRTEQERDALREQLTQLRNPSDDLITETINILHNPDESGPLFVDMFVRYSIARTIQAALAAVEKEVSDA